MSKNPSNSIYRQFRALYELPFSINKEVQVQDVSEVELRNKVRYLKYYILK